MFFFESADMLYMPLTTLLQGLFIDIKHMKFTYTDTKQTIRECENLNCFIQFLNKDITLNISLVCLKLAIHVDEGQLKKRLSQFFHLGPIFHL